MKICKQMIYLSIISTACYASTAISLEVEGGGLGVFDPLVPMDPEPNKTIWLDAKTKGKNAQANGIFIQTADGFHFRIVVDCMRKEGNTIFFSGSPVYPEGFDFLTGLGYIQINEQDTPDRIGQLIGIPTEAGIDCRAPKQFYVDFLNFVFPTFNDHFTHELAAGKFDVEDDSSDDSSS